MISHVEQRSSRAANLEDGSFFLSRVVCAMQVFDAKVDKELIQEWTEISRQPGSSSNKKTTAELTERVSDVLGGVPPPVRHRQERSTVEKVS